ncbi:Y-family DNA polymerase [Thiomicrorhabdus sp.]|uniref:Y-family DNA polymerase n=1 Tax=Thiomicrorhabdus sp. TaxID=2039724 RepID=UPI0029C855DA|nr:Y-family DNA polymerase [Thiomicrorhabdus sp.]
MPLYALVDGNSFYASCQIAFQPWLKHRPVVVLSNNDGCIVAANDLAKQLDRHYFKQRNLGAGGYHAAMPNSMMFQPYYKVAGLLKKHDTVVFSSNYELYEDMSHRMHRITAGFAERQAIYSIDESFLDFGNLTLEAAERHARKLRQTVDQYLGLPVAVGLGRSKTEAKLANRLAKKLSYSNGVFNLGNLSEKAHDALLKTLEVGEIWGVGKRMANRLHEQNIHTAYDLKHADSKTVRRLYSVHLERTVQELNGQACLPFYDAHPYKRQIISSRSFGRNITDLQEMRQAVTYHVCKAAEKLRRQQCRCTSLSVHIRTADHSFKPTYRNQQSIVWIRPSDDSIVLSRYAHQALRAIWQSGFDYAKAGVVLSDIEPWGTEQFDLFSPPEDLAAEQKSTNLMQLMDRINRHNGQNSLQLGSSGLLNNSWKMRRNLMSPRYTTQWGELLTVN